MIKYEKRVFYKTFINSAEMVQVLNHDHISKRDIISIYREGEFIIVIYEKIVEVR